MSPSRTIRSSRLRVGPASRAVAVLNAAASPSPSTSTTRTGRTTILPVTYVNRAMKQIVARTSQITRQCRRRRARAGDGAIYAGGVASAFDVQPWPFDLQSRCVWRAFNAA